MPSKTKVKISRKLRKVIHNAPCSSKTLSSTRVRQDGKLSNKQKQSVTVNLAAPACQRKVRTTLQDGAFKHVKDPIARRQLIDQKIKSLVALASDLAGYAHARAHRRHPHPEWWALMLTSLLRFWCLSSWLPVRG